MDRQSDTTTLSPTPFSPFSPAHSTHSFQSGSEAGTSDEPADLGDFSTVFRALGQFHLHTGPPLTIANAIGRTESQLANGGTPSSSLVVSPSDDEERDLIDFNDYGDDLEASQASTVWNQSTISDYLTAADSFKSGVQPQRRRAHSLSTRDVFNARRSDDLLTSETENNDDLDGNLNISVSPAPSISRSQSRSDSPQSGSSATNNHMPAIGAFDILDQPSLGFLDEALNFLQSESARFAATREAGLSIVRVPASGSISAANSSSLPLSRSLSQKEKEWQSQSQASTSESRSSAWRHVIEPRRKRRRKRGNKNGAANGTGTNSAAGGLSATGSGQEVEGEPEAGGAQTPMGDVVDGSSSNAEADYAYGGGGGKSMPATPPRALRRTVRGGKGKQPALAVTIPGSSSAHKLSHSRSTPSLRPGPISFMSTPSLNTTTGAAAIASADPRVLRIRALATKLRMLFTDEAEALSIVIKGLGLSQALRADADGDEYGYGEFFVDPRGRSPEEEDPIVHVFIDHSNILIGFLNYLRRFPSRRPPPSETTNGQYRHHGWHMSHAALTLILERGRPVNRRVMVASSPLYQPMDSAERLGYEVRVYARVPDMGDGADRLTKVGTGGRMGRSEVDDKRRTRRRGAPMLTHARKLSNGESAESDPGSLNPSTNVGHEKGHSRSTSLTTNVASSSAGRLAVVANGSMTGSNGSPTTANGSGITTPQRIRYREQGVDELLQLKLLQAVSSLDTPHPPTGSTIVLATGDGNVGQFNDEGFRGCVRTALKRGWRVELYAWESGMSRSWLKEFGSGSGGEENAGSAPYGDRFRIIGLEKFAQDLLELP